MAAYKDEKRGTWYVSFHYYDWTGKNCRKVKRGFKTKREAIEWEHHFRMKEGAVRAGYPSVAFKAAVRHLHIKPLIRLVGPGVSQTQKFTDRGVVRAVPGVAPGKAAGCRREAQGVGRTGIHPHSLRFAILWGSAVTHLFQSA